MHGNVTVGITISRSSFVFSQSSVNCDPTTALQRKLNSKILTHEKIDAIDTQRYYRVRCSIPQPPKLYRLPKLHKPGIPMLSIVSFCGSLMYQLSKYSTVDHSAAPYWQIKTFRKLQSKKILLTIVRQYRNLAITNYFDVRSPFTSIPLRLALQCIETAIQQSTVKLPVPLPTEDIMDLLNLCLTHRITFSTTVGTTVNTTNSCMDQSWGCLFLLLSNKLRCNTWRSVPLTLSDKRYRFGYATLTPLDYVLTFFR